MYAFSCIKKFVYIGTDFRLLLQKCLRNTVVDSVLHFHVLLFCQSAIFMSAIQSTPVMAAWVTVANQYYRRICTVQ